jgi:hypothetical protein
MFNVKPTRIYPHLWQRYMRQCDHQGRNVQKKTVVRIIANSELVRFQFTGCFKKSFTLLKEYINLLRGQTDPTSRQRGRP